MDTLISLVILLAICSPFIYLYIKSKIWETQFHKENVIKDNKERELRNLRKDSYLAVKLYEDNDKINGYSKNEIISTYLNRKYGTWKYIGIRPRYSNHCHGCGKEINSFTDLECNDCGWLICSHCGSCSKRCKGGLVYKIAADNEIKKLSELSNIEPLKQRFIEIENKRKFDIQNDPLILSEKDKEIQRIQLEMEKKDQRIVKEREEYRIRREQQVKEVKERINELKKHARTDGVSEGEWYLTEMRTLEEFKYELFNKKFNENDLSVNTILYHDTYRVMVVTKIENNVITLKELSTAGGRERMFYLGYAFYRQIGILE